jgi:lipopolysaccharide/colanic/teichoic acid biosynthesis glycosyltransferase
MKILVVHQHYLLPGQPGGSRFNEMARLWAAEGHDVTVIAGTLNYTTGEIPERFRGRWITKEKDGPVTVWRCAVPASYTKGYLGRMWAFLGFTFSATTAALRASVPDVVLSTSPPLIAAIPGWVMARLRGRFVPWIFEIRDLWPESAITTGVLRSGSLLTRALYLLEAWACRVSNKVNVLTPAFREDIIQRGLVKADKVVFVPNGADTELFTPGPPDPKVRQELGWGDRFVVMYAGAHGRANALSQLIDAAEALKDRSDILIACVGDGPERAQLTAEAERRKLINIVFHGPQSKDRMPAITRACDVGTAVLQDNPTFKTVYPNKVFDYMACARPVLLAIDGVARTLVCDQAKAGIFVPPENGKSFADAVRRLVDDSEGRKAMGSHGLAWVSKEAARDALAQRYLGIMKDLAKTKAKPEPVPTKSRPQRIKNFFDRTIALVALILLSPVLLVVALAILVSMGRPVFFRQQRPGYKGRPFLLTKFRTMTLGAGADAQRLTPLGRFLRSTSLDELPELWNVLCGQMSLVGPRPLLMQYLSRYTNEQARRHEAMPGITGWAQVHGRNAISWEEKFKYDVWYVDHASVGLDIRILLLTLRQVFTRSGISAAGVATMPEFMGADKGCPR